MKLLKVVLVACSLSAAIAHAQTAAPTDANANTNAQQVAQSNVTPSEGRIARHAPAAAQKDNECVGPVSFCNIFFGS
jgi:hypothetical protein